MNYSSNVSSWKPLRWVRLSLTFMMRDLYINPNLKSLTKFTSSSRNTTFKDILSWNISQMIPKTIPIRTNIVISFHWSRISRISGYPEFDRKSMETETKAWLELPKRKSLRTNTSIRRKKSKRVGLWESQSGIWVGKLTNWVRSFEIITEFTRSISSTRIG